MRGWLRVASSSSSTCEYSAPCQQSGCCASDFYRSSEQIACDFYGSSYRSLVCDDSHRMREALAPLVEALLLVDRGIYLTEQLNLQGPDPLSEGTEEGAAETVRLQPIYGPY